MTKAPAMPCRRLLLTASLAALAASTAPLLTACGFHLRRPPEFAFRSIYVDMPASSTLGAELKRQLASAGLQVITDAAEKNRAQVILQALQDSRERSVVGLNAAGQVREYQLRVRFGFRLVTPAGYVALPDAEILREIDQSYSESAALSKEAEADMLYQSMQSDVVQQALERIAAIQLPASGQQAGQ